MMALRTLEEYELRDSKVDVRVEAEKSANKREKNPGKAFSGLTNLVCGRTAEYI